MTADRHADAHLVREARDGSRAAAEELAERHWRRAWRVAHGITGDAGLAEDVVQEAMMAALGALDRFDSDRAAFATWLHRITVNRAIDAGRRRRRDRELEAAADVVHEWERRTTDADFLAAIAELRPAHRAVVVLRYGLDYSPPEIAEVLELSVGTVHSRLARALDILRQTTESPHAG